MDSVRERKKERDLCVSVRDRKKERDVFVEEGY